MAPGQEKERKKAQLVITLNAIGDELTFLILRTCETSTVKGPEEWLATGAGQFADTPP